MKKLIKVTKVTDGINITKQECDKINKSFEFCIRAKQTRLVFSENRIRASRPLQIIHSDVCGPNDPCWSTWDNKRYMLTLMHDYTHYIVVQLLTNKNEAFGF